MYTSQLAYSPPQFQFNSLNCNVDWTFCQNNIQYKSFNRSKFKIFLGVLIKYMNSKFLSRTGHLPCTEQCNFKHDLPRQATKA